MTSKDCNSTLIVRNFFWRFSAALALRRRANPLLLSRFISACSSLLATAWSSDGLNSKVSLACDVWIIVCHTLFLGLVTISCSSAASSSPKSAFFFRGCLDSAVSYEVSVASGPTARFFFGLSSSPLASSSPESAFFLRGCKFGQTPNRLA